MTRLNTKSYAYALESFNEISFDLTPSERYGYRDAAMEALTGPDAGMVLERVYKNIESRASINFGKIPESMGDLTRFARYKTISDTFTLLDRQTTGQKIMELELAHQLHDTIIKCREDFAFGFRTDSQFLKTTYNTMVYSLCELLNLCSAIYVDMLKAVALNKEFTYKPYTDLLLVKNIQKFVDMYKSGEWTNIMTTIRRDPKNMVTLVNVVYGENAGNRLANDGNSLMNFLVGPGKTLGAIGAYTAVSAKYAATHTMGPLPTSGPNPAQIVKAGLVDIPKAVWTSAMKAKGLGGAAAKVAVIAVAIFAALMLVRGLISLFYSGAYKLNDILDDNEKVIKAHMDHNVDLSGNTAARDKQVALYNALSGVQSHMLSKILKSDAAGKKDIKESNKVDFAPSAMSRSEEAPSADDFSIG